MLSSPPPPTPWPALLPTLGRPSLVLPQATGVPRRIVLACAKIALRRLSNAVPARGPHLPATKRVLPLSCRARPPHDPATSLPPVPATSAWLLPPRRGRTPRAGPEPPWLP